MTEAMGRKSLRNAVQGMEAQGQAQQPSLKDKLLAEDVAQQMPEASGIGQIPAPNMESMNMASGGIIAFDDGGEIKHFDGKDGSEVEGPFQKKGYKSFNQSVPFRSANPYMPQDFRNDIAALPGTIASPFVNWYKAREAARNQTLDSANAKNWDSTENATDLPRALPNTSILYDWENPAANETGKNETAKNETAKNVVKQNPNVNLGGGSNYGAGTNPSAANLMQPANGLSGVEDEIAKYSDKYRSMFGETPALVKRDNPFSAVKYEGDSAEKTREQGLGAGLMMAASGFFKNPTFAGGLGDAMTALGNQGWITAKEVKAAKKDEREFNLNMARYNAAYEQGEDEKAYKYAALAQEKEEKIRSLALNTFKAKTDLFSAESTADYQKGSLALKAREIANAASGAGGTGALLNLLKDPANMAIYQQMNEAKNPKLNAITPDVALKQFTDLTNADLTGKGFKKQHPTFNSYYNSLKQNDAPQPKFLGYEPQ
jgi:hypothetical protein